MFYGWVIVGLSFVLLFVSVGAVVQTFPVFLLPLSQEFGVGLAQVSLIPSALMICGAVWSPFIGRAVGEFPIRNVMLSGAVVMACGAFGISYATEFWQIVLGYGVSFSFALSALGIISCNAILVNWFERRRVMALGLAMLGMSISGAVMIPAAAWLLESYGWRVAYRSYAVMALVLIPLVAWLAVTRPSDLGLEPDGREPKPSADSNDAFAGADRIATTREMLTNPNLWWLAVACGLCFLGSTGLMNHGIAFAKERGIEAIRAAGFLSAVSIGAACGKVVFGLLAPRLGERESFGVGVAIQVLCFAIFLQASSYPVLVATAALYGLGLGGISPLQAALLAKSVGVQNFGRAQGLIGPLMIPLQVMGAPLAGWIFDTRGSYDLALWIFLVTVAFAFAALAMLRLPREDLVGVATPASPEPSRP